MSRIAVCNSAGLIALCQIEHLHILLKSYDSVLIPPEVRDEVNYPLGAIQIRAMSTPEIVHSFPIRIHRGESAAIALALDIPGCEVVLDDFKARQLAHTLGLKVIGTVGLMIRAKLEGRLVTIRPVLDALDKVGFHLSATLRSDALRIAGE